MSISSTLCNKLQESTKSRKLVELMKVFILLNKNEFGVLSMPMNNNTREVVLDEHSRPKGQKKQ